MGEVVEQRGARPEESLHTNNNRPETCEERKSQHWLANQRQPRWNNSIKTVSIFSNTEFYMKHQTNCLSLKHARFIISKADKKTLGQKALNTMNTFPPILLLFHLGQSRLHQQTPVLS